MANLDFPAWQAELEAVIREADPGRLKLRVSVLEKAIFDRVQEIAGRTGYEDERHAIDNAIHKLREIQRDKLDCPPITAPRVPEARLRPIP